MDERNVQRSHMLSKLYKDAFSMIIYYHKPTPKTSSRESTTARTSISQQRPQHPLRTPRMTLRVRLSALLLRGIRPRKSPLVVDRACYCCLCVALSTTPAKE